MKRRRNRTPRWVRALAALILAGALTFGLLLGAVMGGDRTQISGQPATMLILGCQVMPWGPSILLQDRLDTALSYLREHPDVTVIVSGGQGADEVESEAACMRGYLRKAGIDDGRILMEDRSSNTHRNMLYSVQVMEENGLKLDDGVLIVSNGFHLTRARMLWRRVTGREDVLSVLAAPSSHAPSRLAMYLREPLALVKSFLFDR